MILEFSNVVKLHKVGWERWTSKTVNADVVQSSEGSEVPTAHPEARATEARGQYKPEHKRVSVEGYWWKSELSADTWAQHKAVDINMNNRGGGQFESMTT